MKNTILICDIDGVLADNTHRLKYMEEKNYAKFYSVEEVSKDKLIPTGKFLINALCEYGPFCVDKVLLLTGRNEMCYEATKEWLRQNHIHYDDIMFRGEFDYRPSPVLKKESVDEYIRSQKEHDSKIIYVDDDPENVKAVASLPYDIVGITFGTSRFSA